MLIQTSKSLNYGQRKPQQWGPLSAVQYAVRVNADRLGIDPFEVIPAWEGESSAGTIFRYLPVYQTALWNTDTSINCYVSSRFRLGGASNLLKRKFSYTFSVKENAYVGGGSGGVLFCIHTIESNRLGYLQRFSSSQLLWNWNNYITNGIGLDKVVYISGYDYDTNPHIYTVTFDGIYHTLYRDGIRIMSHENGSQPEIIRRTLLYIETSYRPFTNYGNNSYFGGLFSDVLSDEQTAQLHDTPYALLMPVPRPVYFDLGGGGTLVNISIDTWNSIFNSFSISTDNVLKALNSESDIFDSKTTASTSESDIFDSSSSISTEEEELLDASCSISSSSEYYVDLKAALSTLEEETIDTTTNVSTLTEIIHYFDTKTEIHTLLTKLLDSVSNISNEETQQLDTKLAISNILDSLIDSKVLVSSELLNSIDSKTEVKTVTINLIDTKGKISSSALVELDTKSKIAVELAINIDTDTYISMLNSIVISLDTKATVANEEIFYIDLIDRISTNESVQFDSLTKALESILVSTDLRSSISNDEIRLIDFKVPVSNEELALLDLKASISNQAIILTDSITAASFQLIESIDTLTHIHATSTTSISLDTLIKVYEEVSSYTDLKLFVATNGFGIVTDPRIEVLTKLFGNTDATNSIGIESLTKVREIQALEKP